MLTKESLLSLLRDPKTEPPLFRETTASLSILLAKDFPRKNPSILVPILRSGITLLPAFSSTFPIASIGILGIQREKKTAHPLKYYTKLPPITFEDHILILDPMLATGGTACLALSTLIQQGASPKNITILSIIAAKEGIATVKKAHPDANLHILATDPKLSPSKMIIPGLGDFGDRYFGTEQ